MDDDHNTEMALRLAVSQRPEAVDARARLASILTAEGRHPEALSLLRDGLMFAGTREDRLAALADAFLAIDALPDALELLQTASRHCPGDEGIRERLAALSAQLKDGQTATRQLFNQYAAGFENHLAALRYIGPQKIAAILAPYADRFAGGCVIDIGCGTGLMGPYLRRASYLTGVDLSPAMLNEARRKNIYDVLIEADIVEYCLRVQPKAALVTAADVMGYIGDLQKLFAAVKSVLVNGGLFTFTIENYTGDGFITTATKRASHSEAYIRTMAKDAGFTVLAYESLVLRYDSAAPVDGLAFLLELL